MNNNKHSSLIEELSKGEPLKGITVIDCHAHLGQWFNFNIPKFKEDALKQSMDILGIDKMCVSALASCGPNFLFGNEWVHKIVEKSPLKFFGYIVLNPNYPNMIMPEIKKHWKKSLMQAIKIHPVTHDYPPDGEEYRKIYDYLEKTHGLLLSHVWGINDVKKFGKLAKEYSNVRFIFGHSGGTPKAIYEAISIASMLDNVFLDLTGSYHYQGIIELMVREVGAEKVLFGTDAPFLDPKPAIGRVVYTDISDEDKMKILGLNMEKILLAIQ
jgi:hypothetical protein